VISAGLEILQAPESASQVLVLETNPPAAQSDPLKTQKTQKNSLTKKNPQRTDKARKP
jgi:hypothetical protein